MNRLQRRRDQVGVSYKGSRNTAYTRGSCSGELDGFWRRRGAWLSSVAAVSAGWGLAPNWAWAQEPLEQPPPAEAAPAEWDQAVQDEPPAATQAVPSEVESPAATTPAVSSEVEPTSSPQVAEAPPPQSELVADASVATDALETGAAAAEVVEDPEEAPSLKIGMGVRLGAAVAFNDPVADGAAFRLHDGVANQLNVRPYFSGQLTEAIGFTANLEITDTSVDILDAIVQIKLADEFQLWMGQHIPAMERNNFNGPFYNNGWNLPISVQTLPFDIAGRDLGLTAWGLVGGGVLKYHVSVVDLHPPASTPVGDVMLEPAEIGNARVSARLTLNLLDPENYYYTSGTYYGAQDTLALGVVVHAQKGVDAVAGSDQEVDNDLLAVAADLLFEKNFGAGGTLTVEGGYWNYEGTGTDYAANQGTSFFGRGAAGPIPNSSYLAGVSWLTPGKVGYGHLQPLVKVQIGDYEPDTVVVADVGLGYIVDSFNHRWFLNYRYQDNGGDNDPMSMLQIGAQLQL